MINGIRISDPRRLNKGRGSKFCVVSRIQHETPEECWRTYRPKRYNITIKMKIIVRKSVSEIQTTKPLSLSLLTFARFLIADGTRSTTLFLQVYPVLVHLYLDMDEGGLRPHTVHLYPYIGSSIFLYRDKPVKIWLSTTLSNSQKPADNLQYTKT